VNAKRILKCSDILRCAKIIKGLFLLIKEFKVLSQKVMVTLFTPFIVKGDSGFI